ncbi:MAG: hypothetical protein GC157_07475 [Frankiales bacterium]|nr:hypothetical protein [Frankiales bacterium]
MTTTTARRAFEARPWTGPTRHYDILKEGAIALVVVTLLVVGLAALFSSPDDPALTFKGWATDSPDTLYATTVSELAGTSETAGYGPPYNTNSDGLSVGPLFLQKLGGVTHPIDTAQDFVVTPLQSTIEPADVTQALGTWTAAGADQQQAWATAYDDAVQATADDNGDLHLDAVAAGDYGPVPTLAQAVVDLAKTGGYDNALTGQGSFFQTDQTKQLMLMGDGGYMEDRAVSYNLGGDTWGMMNEAGSWPGQIWLAFASVWYQPPAFNTDGTTLTDNADAIIFMILLLLCAVFILTPFIPGLRSLPRWIPLHRLVWKDYYRRYGRAA